MALSIIDYDPYTRECEYKYECDHCIDQARHQDNHSKVMKSLLGMLFGKKELDKEQMLYDLEDLAMYFGVAFPEDNLIIKGKDD